MLDKERAEFLCGRKGRLEFLQGVIVKEMGWDHKIEMSGNIRKE